MKKFLLMLVSSLFAFNVLSAGPTSCTVPNSDGVVVTLSQTSGYAKDGRVEIQVNVTKDGKIYTGYVKVLVNVYDAMTDQKVDVVSINCNSGRGVAYSYKVEKGKSCYFEINKASCQN